MNYRHLKIVKQNEVRKFSSYITPPRNDVLTLGEFSYRLSNKLIK